MTMTIFIVLVHIGIVLLAGGGDQASPSTSALAMIGVTDTGDTIPHITAIGMIRTVATTHMDITHIMVGDTLHMYRYIMAMAGDMAGGMDIRMAERLLVEDL